MLPRSVFVRTLISDSLGPSPTGGFGAATPLVGGIAEFKCQYLGKHPIVQPLAHRTVSGAGTTHTGARDPGTFDESLTAQRVEMEAHRGRVQPEASGEFDCINWFVVRTHQFENSLALPVTPQAMRSSGLVLVVLTQRIHPLVRLPNSYLKDIIHS